MKPDTVFNCFNIWVTWAEENGVSAKDITILRNLREKVLTKATSYKKHTSIKDYFKIIWISKICDCNEETFTTYSLIK